MTDPIDIPRRHRRPSLGRILETAKKKGCDKVVITRAGDIVIVMGPATESGGGDIGNNGSQENPWDAAPAGSTGRLGR